MHLRDHHYYRSSTCCIWLGTKSWHGRDYGTPVDAAHLTGYYRCNIVNNAPLNRGHVYICTSHGRSPLLAKPGTTLPPIPSLSPRTTLCKPLLPAVYRWIFILCSDTAVNTKCLHINQCVWLGWPLSRHPFVAFIRKDVVRAYDLLVSYLDRDVKRLMFKRLSKAYVYRRSSFRY